MTNPYQLHSDPSYTEEFHHKEMGLISKDPSLQNHPNYQNKAWDISCTAKRFKRDISAIDSSIDDCSRESRKAPLEPLTPHRIQVRMKQVDYGKNTRGYDRYLESVPK